MLDSLLSFFMDYGYAAVFSILLLCGMGVPIPEDVTLVAGGVLAGLGAANVHIMVLVSYLGVMAGDSIMFGLGYFFNDRLRQSRWFAKILSPPRMVKIDSLYGRYNNRVLFMARFMPGLRAPVFVMAGMNPHISFWRFLVMDGLAALISVPVWVYIGDYGAENHDWLLKIIHEFKWAIFSLIAVAIIYWWFYRRGKQQRLKKLLAERANRACNRKHKKAEKPQDD